MPCLVAGSATRIHGGWSALRDELGCPHNVFGDSENGILSVTLHMAFLEMVLFVGIHLSEDETVSYLETPVGRRVIPRTLPKLSIGHPVAGQSRLYCRLQWTAKNALEADSSEDLSKDICA